MNILRRPRSSTNHGRCARLDPLALTPVLLLGAVALAGCYKPSILSGGLRCAADSLLCPDGFTCVSGVCLLGAGPDAGSGPDVPDAIGDDHRGVDAPDGPGTCTAPNQTPVTEGCVSGVGVCDPVCDTGCCPGAKCSAINSPQNGGTSLAQIGCVPLAPSSRELNQPCTPDRPGMPARSDNCQRGLVCVDILKGSQCLKLCRDDNDCTGGVHCEQRNLDGTGTGTVTVKVCGVPTTECVPTAETSTCPSGTTCYLAPPDGTICDLSSGSGKANADCVYPRDCLPPLTCGAGKCHPVCDTAATPDLCLKSNTMCIKVGTLQYGYCN